LSVPLIIGRRPAALAPYMHTSSVPDYICALHAQATLAGWGETGEFGITSSLMGQFDASPMLGAGVPPAEWPRSAHSLEEPHPLLSPSVVR